MCGEPGAFEATERVPVRVPVPVGVNVTLTVQDAPAPSDVPQPLVCAKLPVVETPVMDADALPVLVTVTCCAGLVVPTCRLANVNELGETDSAGAVGPPPPPYTSNSESCAAGQHVVAGEREPDVPAAAGREVDRHGVAGARVEGVARRAEDLRVRAAVGRPEHGDVLRAGLPVRRQLEHQPVDRLGRAEVDGERLRERAVGALPVRGGVAVDRVAGDVRPVLRRRRRRTAGGEVARRVEARAGQRYGPARRPAGSRCGPRGGRPERHVGRAGGVDGERRRAVVGLREVAVRSTPTRSARPPCRCCGSSRRAARWSC